MNIPIAAKAAPTGLSKRDVIFKRNHLRLSIIIGSRRLLSMRIFLTDWFFNTGAAGRIAQAEACGYISITFVGDREKSISVGSTSGRERNSQLKVLLHLLDDQGGVLAAEAEGVGKGAGECPLAGLVGDVVEVTIGVRVLIIDGGRDEVMVHAQDGGNKL